MSLSRVQLCHNKHTLTSLHQFSLAWADCSSPPSFASTDPHLHTTLSSFVEHADVSGVFQRSFLGLLQTSNRECLTSVVSQRGHVHLPHQLLPSQRLCPQGCQGMSTGTETHLRASPHQRSCRICRVSKRDHAVPVSESFSHELVRTARSCRRQHAVESFDTSCLVLAFLLVSLQYPLCSIVNESSVRHALARANSVHLRSLVLTSGHKPFATPRRSENLPTAIPSHLQRNAHQCRVQRTTSSSQ